VELDTKRLQGKRVAMLAADGFEYVELTVPRLALRAAGATVDVISLHAGRIRGMNATAPTRTVRVDRTVDEANPDDYDALFIPGGFVGPDFVRQSEKAREFVRAFEARGKPIATLCHGPWVLASAGLVSDRTLASWPGVRDDLVHAGAVWRDQPVVRDGNWVSSRGPQDLREFVPAVIELYAEGPVLVRHRAATAGNGASSPQPREPIRAALMAARLLPGPTVRTLAVAAVAAAAGAYAYGRAARASA
jgi:deglycase